MTHTAITTTGPTITVSSSADLKDAYATLSNQTGGGTILLEGGDYGSLWLYQYGVTDGDQPVIIASADPSDPAQFDTLFMREVSNLRIEGVVVDSTGSTRDDYLMDLWIDKSTNVQIVDSVFQHDTSGALKATGKPVEQMGLIRSSDQILFEGNYVDGYMHGLQAIDSTEIGILGNEITNIQGDGIRVGGLQNSSISDNYLHDFYGIDQNITHSDLIQVWGTNSYLLTKDLTISGNVLMASDSGSQSIFIRNGDWGKAGDSTSGHFQDITITDNLIYNGHVNGIAVSDTDGLVVDNNTVLWNPDTGMAKGDETPVNYKPAIVVRNTLDASITDNIVYDIQAPDSASLSGNQFVTYGNPDYATYVGNHFVNPLSGADVTLEDLVMLPDSPWRGLFGSSIGNEATDTQGAVVAVIRATASADDHYEMAFDAGESFDADAGRISEADGYSFHWSFSDGTTATGVTATKSYMEGGFKGVTLEVRLEGEVVGTSLRNFAVETKDIFAFDFEAGVVDISDGTPEIVEKGTLVADGDDTGYLIGDGRKLEIVKGTEKLYGLDEFGLTLDLTPTGNEPSGTFLYMHETMHGRILEDGRIAFQLKTDQGSYSLNSREPVFNDGGTHQIGIAFDGDAGQLELFADGESVSVVEAWGTTVSKGYNLTFGNTWQDSMDAIVDDILMTTDAASAGMRPVDSTPKSTPPKVADDGETPAEAPGETSGETPKETSGETPPVQPREPDVNPPARQPTSEDTPSPEMPDSERGVPTERVETDEDSGNFLSRIIDKLLSVLGLGRDDDVTKVAPPEEQSAMLLSDMLPVTEELCASDLDEEDCEGEEAAFADLAA